MVRKRFVEDNDTVFSGTKTVRQQALEEDGYGLDDEDEPTPQPTTNTAEDFPEPMAAQAFHGIAGEFVQAIKSTTEADPVALLISYLIGAGNLIGRGPHFMADGSRHGTNEFAVFVGKTGAARKGTSWGRVQHVLNGCLPDDKWEDRIVHGGLSSGEGLKWAIRDPIEKREPVKKNGRIVDHQVVVSDPGVSDKRLLVVEPEFANVLYQAERSGNTLSVCLRQAWESDKLRNLTKNDPVRVTGAHASLIGHITPRELRRMLTSTTMANGLANRFLWFYVRRHGELPFGGYFPDDQLEYHRQKLREAIQYARTVDRVQFALEARRTWNEAYPRLTQEANSLADEMCSRNAPHCLRLALIFCLLDKQDAIRSEHLQAAMAIVDYANDSIDCLFGDATGNGTADEILAALRKAGATGLTRTQISALFGRNQASSQIGAALAELELMGKARRGEPVKTEGRPVELWHAVEGG